MLHDSAKRSMRMIFMVSVASNRRWRRKLDSTVLPIRPDPHNVAEKHPKLAGHMAGHAHRAGDDIVSQSSIDRLTHAIMGRFTSSVSPVSLALAYFDWAAHLAE